MCFSNYFSLLSVRCLVSWDRLWIYEIFKVVFANFCSPILISNNNLSRFTCKIFALHRRFWRYKVIKVSLPTKNRFFFILNNDDGKGTQRTMNIHKIFLLSLVVRYYERTLHFFSSNIRFCHLLSTLIIKHWNIFCQVQKGLPWSYEHVRFTFNRMNRCVENKSKECRQ